MALLCNAGHSVWSHAFPGGSNASVLWVRLETPDLDEFPNLRVLVCNCTDASHLPLEECARRSIRVISLQDCREQMPSVHSTAEHTIGLILALLRKLPTACDHVKGGGWDRWQFVGRELRGKQVGIVGFGRVGAQVTKLLLAFGAVVEWCDDRPPFMTMPLGELLPWADIVTVHASLNDTSRNMFNDERFSQMKTGAYFVNTARGAIVDEGALLTALESGRLAGAALDVVQDEPNVNLALLEFARREPGRLLLTPHIAGCTREGLTATELMIARKLVQVLTLGDWSKEDDRSKVLKDVELKQLDKLEGILAAPKPIATVNAFEAEYSSIVWAPLKGDAVADPRFLNGPIPD